MKNHRIKNYLKIEFIIFGILLFSIGCQKDDFSILKENHSSNNSRIKVNYGNDVSRIAVDYIKLKTNNSFGVSSFSKNHLSLSPGTVNQRETTFGTVETDKEVVVENQLNTKHTFNINTLNAGDDSVINLIVVQTANNIYEYFLKYTVTGDKYFNEDGTLDMTRFTGTIKTYNNDGDLAGITNVDNGSITGVDGTNSPCPDEDESNDDEDDSDDNNSGGGASEDDDPSNNDDNSGNGSETESGGGWLDGGPDWQPCTLTNVYFQPCSVQIANGDENPQPHTPDQCGAGTGAGYVYVWDCRNATANRSNDPTLDPCDGSVGVINDLKSDCLKLKENISDVPLIKTRLHTLKVDGGNFEKGLRVDIHPENGYTPTQILSDDNGPAHINIPVNPYTVVIAHTHPDEDVYAMFSASDIIKMGEIINHVQSSLTQFVEPVEITHILIANGRTFAIRFDDAASVQTLLDIYENKVEKKKFQKKLKKDYNSDHSTFLPYESTTTVAKQQEHLYNLFSAYNLNMSLYEANYDANGFINDWQKINKDTLDKEPCN